MSLRDTPEFKAARERMLARSAESHSNFERRLLEIQAEQAAEAPVGSVMTPEEFVAHILPEGLEHVPAGDEDDRTDDR